MSDHDCREAEAIHLLHPGSADDHGGGEDVPRRLGLRESRLVGGHREGEEEVGRGETHKLKNFGGQFWETYFPKITKISLFWCVFLVGKFCLFYLF